MRELVKSDSSQIKGIDRRIDLALQSSEVGLWELNTLSGAIWCSPSFDQILGTSTFPSEWNLDSFLKQVAPADRDHVKEAFGTAMRTSHLNTDCRILRLDRSEGWVSLRAQAFKDSHGVTNRLTGVIVDITRVKTESEELKRSIHGMKDREDFIATVCHDMRNHLIGGNRLLEYFVTGVFRHYLDDEHKELLKWLMQSNFSVLQLTNNLIDVYRWEQDADCFLFTDTNLQSIVSCTVKQMNLLAKLQDVSIIEELPQAAMTIRGSSKELQRVLLNLLDNALKFSPANSTITVRLLGLADYALLEVEDQGPGVPQEEQDQLFKRFKQGNIGMRFSTGTGIGLYLCKKIVDAHGGTMKCRCQTDGPTIFQVYLPISKSVRNPTTSVQ
jgi:signal transduction histidine kinase